MTESGWRTGRSGGGRLHGLRGGACLAAVLVLLLFACGEASPEAQLAEAREELQRARQEVASAEARYEEATRRLEKAREAREEAADALEEAREELAEARAEVGRYATDDAIFRAVQSRLLKDEKLSEVAIPVRVQNGVVILTGEVPKEDLEERAVGIANEVAGVIEVKSRIQVRDRPKEPRSEEGRGESGDEGGGSASEGRRSGGGASQGEAAAQEE